jgi:myo-inositol-1(or 4)-monophosphatase
MIKQSDWIEVLIECEKNVKHQIEKMDINNQPPLDIKIGAGGDKIKWIDIVAENAIIEILKNNEISFTQISEDSGIKKYGKTPDDCYITIDPMDGTTNFTRGIPFYATSIAVSKKPIMTSIHTALISDLNNGLIYTAQKGEGAYLGNRKIFTEKSLKEEIVVSLDLNNFKIHEIMHIIKNIIMKTKHIRHLGANALELCYIADGKIDVFIDMREIFRATDIAAAWLIIKEAGGKITSIQNKPINTKLSPKQKLSFMASVNDTIHKEILNLIKRI